MFARSASRVRCDIDALACTAVEAHAAHIVDLSRGGAKVRLGVPFPAGTRIYLDVKGDYYWGTVAWDEVDRMGICFRSAVTTGTLAVALRQLSTPLAARAIKAASFGKRGAAS